MFELFAFLFVATFVALAVLGHVLLLVPSPKLFRKDMAGGLGRRTQAASAPTADRVLGTGTMIRRTWR